ncbi:MAG: DNA polymerase III subunit beta [Flavobacteriia bacterium]|nr:DNA polymerase III subunit beta [Flavobacteriia bacterium]
MNFIVSSSYLLRHLQSVSGVLNTSNTIPILDNFLFDIENKVLSITASDTETTMITKLDVEANSNGKIAIPAKLLLEFLKNLPDQPCTFSIDFETKLIEITYDNGNNKMIGYDAEEFPKLPSHETTDSIKLTGEILSKAISKTLFATSNDDLKPVLCGVFCEFTPEYLTFVATDAHKMVVYTRKDSAASGSASFIIPKKPLNAIKANISVDSEVLLEYNKTNAIFSFNDIKLVCRLIDGKYPNYHAVIPLENPNVLKVERNVLLSALKRVSIFVNKSTYQIRLKIAGSELKIDAEDIDFSNESNERMTCVYNGEDMEIGFNARFLIEILSNIDSEEIILNMSTPKKAGIINPATYSNPHEDLLMLIMPITIN